jgi:hypothetical protein
MTATTAYILITILITFAASSKAIAQVLSEHLKGLWVSYVSWANTIRKGCIFAAWGISLDTFSPLATWVVCLIVGLSWLIDVVVFRLLYAYFLKRKNEFKSATHVTTTDNDK